MLTGRKFGLASLQRRRIPPPQLPWSPDVKIHPGSGPAPLRAAAIANNAPVSFGALGSPIIGLAAVTSLPLLDSHHRVPPAVGQPDCRGVQVGWTPVILRWLIAIGCLYYYVLPSAMRP